MANIPAALLESLFPESGEGSGAFRRSRTPVRILKKPSTQSRIAETLGLLPSRGVTYPGRLSVVQGFKTSGPEDLAGLLRHEDVHNLARGLNMTEDDEETLAQLLGHGLARGFKSDKEVNRLMNMLAGKSREARALRALPLRGR